MSRSFRSFSGRACALVVAVGIAGCGGDDDAKPPKQGAQPPRRPKSVAVDPGIELVGPVQHPRIQADGTRMEYGTETFDDGTPMAYADGSPTYLSDGQPIDYRPANLMNRLDQLPSVFLRAGTQEQVIFDGDRPAPRIDPKTGDLCVLAFRCSSSSCSGKGIGGEPFLYGRSTRGAKPDGKGGIASPAPPRRIQDEGAMKSPLICPACDKKTGQRYVLPQAQSEKVRLDAELQRVRAEIFQNRSSPSSQSGS